MPSSKYAYVPPTFGLFVSCMFERIRVLEAWIEEEEVQELAVVCDSLPSGVGSGISHAL